MKITAPAAANMGGERLNHYGPVPLLFKDGVADFDGELPVGIEAYLKANGYGIDGDATPPEAEAGVTVDSRTVGVEQVGSPLRDAAVDPQPGDFLPPVNAGEGDPHGPTVASPGVHAEGERVVAAGPVSTDPDVQTANEQRLAEKLLVEGEAVVPVEPGDFLDEGGLLALSDPASAAEGEKTAEAAREGDEPRGNARLADWQAYARSQGATDADLDGASRDDLRAKYGS